MPLEGIVLAEGLIARRISGACKSVDTFMCSLMSAKPCASQKALATVLPIANIFSFLFVRSFDVLLKVFVLVVSLVAVGVWANTCSIICMRTHV